jgi:hypothetical protein
MNLPTELVQTIMNYLANRPFVEVFQMINAINAEAAKSAAPVEPAQE